MNTKMLKSLVDLSHGEIDCVDVGAFFAQFPRNSENLHDLELLRQFGFVSILNADDEVQEIGVNKKAIDYFRK